VISAFCTIISSARTFMTWSRVMSPWFVCLLQWAWTCHMCDKKGGFRESINKILMAFNQSCCRYCAQANVAHVTVVCNAIQWSARLRRKPPFALHQHMYQHILLRLVIVEYIFFLTNWKKWQFCLTITFKVQK
jgi:hypothetical protein